MDELWMERWQLAKARIEQIEKDPEVAGNLGDYFQKTAGFLLLMLEAKDKAEADLLKNASLEELRIWNDRLYGDLVGEAYEQSYGNPSYAVEKLTRTMDRSCLLSMQNFGE